MRTFTLARPASLDAAGDAATAPGSAYIAGGTDLMQLMRLEAEHPDRLIDLTAAGRTAGMARITAGPAGIRIGALATMAQVAADPHVQRGWPMISQALLSAASPQIRNMGTVGGNLLQRTRCPYFRAASGPCNKRAPGSGCPAIAGENRDLAVLGTSTHCIASMPSDMPVALMALDARVELRGAGGKRRTIALSQLYREPGDAPHLDTTLAPGEIITALVVPASPAAANSTYVKIRDRQSFQFATVSVAVGLDVRGGTIRDARIAFGGVGTVPWRTVQVEQQLRGRQPTEAVFRAAAAQATEGAAPSSQNGFKTILMPRLLARALQTLSA